MLYVQQYSICGNTSYNTQTYIIDIKTFNKEDSD
jgi:hypothetical protein